MRSGEVPSRASTAPTRSMTMPIVVSSPVRGSKRSISGTGCAPAVPPIRIAAPSSAMLRPPVRDSEVSPVFANRRDREKNRWGCSLGPDESTATSQVRP